MCERPHNSIWSDISRGSLSKFLLLPWSSICKLFLQSISDIHFIIQRTITTWITRLCVDCDRKDFNSYIVLVSTSNYCFINNSTIQTESYHHERPSKLRRPQHQALSCRITSNSNCIWCLFIGYKKSTTINDWLTTVSIFPFFLVSSHRTFIHVTGMQWFINPWIRSMNHIHTRKRKTDKVYEHMLSHRSQHLRTVL